MENVKRLSDIEPNPIKRCLTGFEELDYMYGYSDFPSHTEWGMPQGKISLWSGGSGIGKSRLCIEVAKHIASSCAANKVLYIQTEAPISDFASWAKETKKYTNIYCSGESDLDEIIKIIYYINPDVVFIDSVNEIDGFDTLNKRAATRLIKGSDGKVGLKQVTDDCGCHLIMLAQENQDGKTIKGGTALPHLVDIHLQAVPYSKDSTACFTVKVGIKHRFGKRGTAAMFIHYDWGVKCGSDLRLNDSGWCVSHNLPTTTLKQRMIKSMGVMPNSDGVTRTYEADSNDPGLGLHIRQRKTWRELVQTLLF